jgi:pyruvate/2-oxoglutarate dehydrogenase complex dihydrolipoamide dehydrogenase (E3) component
MASMEYDLVAIGGGTAGLVTAAGSTYLGARAALVERDALGGDCLWTGCVPSKALLASARLAAHMARADELGLPPSRTTPDFREVMERMRAARERVAHHDDPERFREMGVSVHFGTARFTAPGELDVEGVGRIRSKRIVIATGARPATPSIPGLEEAGFLTHETAFDQDELPSSMIIVGGGPIGLEFAQIYRRLGADITVIEVMPGILAKEDPDVGDALRVYMEQEGVSFELGTKIQRVEVEGDDRVVVTVDGRRFRARGLFLATGRRPNTQGLELEGVGVDIQGGAVKVDQRLRTTASGVWAAGDVTGGLQFTHAADAMAKTVIRNALLPFSSKVDLSNVPRVTYTDPEVAHIGCSQREAEERGGTVFRYGMDDLDRAIADGAARGFVKISADRKGRILGATILAAGAGELLMPLVLARRKGLTLPDISNTIFPYPTMVEGVKRAADAYQRARLEGPAGKVLRKVVRWLA